MAFSQTDLDNLDKAIARGELLVRIDDKEIKYQTTNEMLVARRFISASLTAQTDPLRTVPRYQLANFADDEFQ
jgi:hypothetical protein